MRNTRAEVIYAHVLMAVQHTGLDQLDLADDVAQLYMQRTPPHARRLEFHAHARGVDPYAVKRANEQLLFRMLRPNGPTRLACEVEEAVVLSLPQPYRDECLRELCSRYGLLAAAMPSAVGDPAAVSLGEFSRDFGEAVLALSKTIGDGHLEPCDAEAAPAAIAELQDVIARATTLMAAHMRLLRPEPGAKRAGTPEPAPISSPCGGL